MHGQNHNKSVMNNLTTLKTKINTKYVWTFSTYDTVNALCIGYDKNANGAVPDQVLRFWKKGFIFKASYDFTVNVSFYLFLKDSVA